jgi:hypothetical protein
VQEGERRTFFWDIAAGKKEKGKGKPVEPVVEEDDAQGEVEGLGEEEE